MKIRSVIEAISGGTGKFNTLIRRVAEQAIERQTKRRSPSASGLHSLASSSSRSSDRLSFRLSAAVVASDDSGSEMDESKSGGGSGGYPLPGPFSVVTSADSEAVNGSTDSGVTVGLARHLPSAEELV